MIMAENECNGSYQCRYRLWESFPEKRNDCSQTADLQVLISTVGHVQSITGYFAFG